MEVPCMLALAALPSRWLQSLASILVPASGLLIIAAACWLCGKAAKALAARLGLGIGPTLLAFFVIAYVVAAKCGLVATSSPRHATPPAFARPRLADRHWSPFKPAARP